MMYINKTIAFLGIVLVLVTGACTKKFLENDLEKAIRENEKEIVAYLQNNNLNYAKTDNGIYYKVTKANPSGQPVELGDQVRAYFKVTLLNNSLVDSVQSGPPFSFGYYSGFLFDGFLQAVSLLKEGEKGTFIIPSNLAFMGQPQQGIPAWSVLKVDLEILSFRSEEEQINAYIAKKDLKNVEVTSTGLRFIRTTTVSGGSTLANGNEVVLKYKGTLLNDVTFDEGEFTVRLGTNAVIPGFEEGIKKMRVGEQATIIFPSEIGYGKNGQGSIPPYTPLLFELTILSKR